MRVGLLYDMANPPGSGRDLADLYTHELDQMERADAWGIGGLWFTEHHFTADYTANPLIWMAAAAARTRRAALGTGVLLPALYDPVRLAEEIATLDQLSNGRVEIGVGLGWALEEFRVFGADPAKRTGLGREALDILRLAWSEDAFDYRGKHFDLRNVRVRPKPLQQPHPPIWGGASTPEGARRVARWRLPLLWVEPEVSRAYLDAYRSAGFPVEEARIDGYINLFVCDDPEAVWPEIRHHFLYQALRPDIKSKRAGPNGSIIERAALRLEDIDARRERGDILVVTPGQTVDAVRKRAAGSRINGFFCHNRICGMSDELSDRHVELLTREVAPALSAE